MNKQVVKQPLIAIVLMALAGAAGAQTYSTHELARTVAADDTEAPSLS